MRIQKTDWGYIEWLEPDNFKEGEEASLRMGKVHIEAGKIMLPHVHYEEQFVYVLEGYGTGYINGEAQRFEPGAMFHMPAGCTHEFVNEQGGPLVHLLVSSPVSVDPDSLIDKTSPAPHERENRLYTAIEAVRTQFLDNVHMAFAIRDANGRVALKSDYFPPFCEKNCRILETNACPCLKQDLNETEASENTFVCLHGLTVLQVPIFWEDQFLGCIQGGYIRQSYGREDKAEVYDAPDSSAFGLLQLLRKVAKAIRNFCEFDQYRRELFEKEASLTSSLDTQKILQTHLRDTENAVTNLKINNHFLFNTLNSMAAMALEGGMLPLYQSIIDLSKMLRYSVRIQDSQVTLQMELEYLETYLKLQKLRYPKELEFFIQVEEALKEAAVPFNFLQPIVENAFTHGFSGCKEKRIWVKIHQTEGIVHFTIENNGSPISEERSRQIQMQMQSSTSHGLSMVYEKLRVSYADEFEMRIEPGSGNGARITIKIPFRLKEESND